MISMTWRRVTLAMFLLAASVVSGQESDFSKQAQAYRKGNEPVAPMSDAMVTFCAAG